MYQRAHRMLRMIPRTGVLHYQSALQRQYLQKGFQSQSLSLQLNRIASIQSQSRSQFGSPSCLDEISCIWPCLGSALIQSLAQCTSPFLVPISCLRCQTPSINQTYSQNQIMVTQRNKILSPILLVFQSQISSKFVKLLFRPTVFKYS